MITLKNDRLEFRFPEVHRDARCTIEFQRTLRIPDDDRDYPLPPGLGRFPLRHEVYDDPYGLDAWDRKHSRRCFVTIANSTQWMAITGERPPTLPPSARHYTEAGLPWFEWYGGDAVAVDGAKKLEKLASVAQLGKKKGEQPLLGNESVEVTRVVGLSAEGITLDREFTSDEILRS